MQFHNTVHTKGNSIVNSCFCQRPDHHSIIALLCHSVWVFMGMHLCAVGLLHCMPSALEAFAPLTLCTVNPLLCNPPALFT